VVLGWLSVHSGKFFSIRVLKMNELFLFEGIKKIDNSVKDAVRISKSLNDSIKVGILLNIKLVVPVLVLFQVPCLDVRYLY
jgi:hypothetical protein